MKLFNVRIRAKNVMITITFVATNLFGQLSKVFLTATTLSGLGTFDYNDLRSKVNNRQLVGILTTNRIL